MNKIYLHLLLEFVILLLKISSLISYDIDFERDQKGSADDGILAFDRLALGGERHFNFKV